MKHVRNRKNLPGTQTFGAMSAEKRADFHGHRGRSSRRLYSEDFGRNQSTNLSQTDHPQMRESFGKSVRAETLRDETAR
jgi:hypothetical protein